MLPQVTSNTFHIVTLDNYGAYHKLSVERDYKLANMVVHPH